MVLDPLSESYNFQSSQFLSDPEIEPKMLEMINSATEELLLISPWIYKDVILESLIIARNRGIIAKIIVRKFKINRDNMNHLISIQKLDMNGIQIAFTDNIHAKILIKDGKELLLSSKNMIDSNAIDMGIWNRIKNEVKKARDEFYLLYNQRFYDSNYIDFSSLNLNLDTFNDDIVMDIYGKKFGKLFGRFKIVMYEGNKIFVSKENIIFCVHAIANKILENLGIKFKRISTDQLWRLRIDGHWHLISEYPGSIKEEHIMKAKLLLNYDRKLHLFWSNDDDRQCVVITDGKIALFINNINYLHIF